MNGERLDARTAVVDNEYIPDRSSTSRQDSSNSNSVDHGRFESIIQRVYLDGAVNELPGPLAEIELPDEAKDSSAVNAAAEYHDTLSPITVARIENEQLEYVTTLAGARTTDGDDGPRCAFRVGISDDTTHVLETIVDPDNVCSVLDYGESGIRHRLVISPSRSVEWETVVPESSKLASREQRDALLEHQVTVLQKVTTTLQRHHGISVDGVIEQVVGGGYLQQGLRTASSVWQNSSLLGQLMRPADSKEKSTGTVDFFNDTGGYGFIATPDSEEDVFYHMEDVGGPDIQEGQEARFNIVDTEKGPRAADLERL